MIHIDAMRNVSRKQKKSGFLHFIQITTVFFLVVMIFSVSAFFIWVGTIQIPDFDLFVSRKVAQSTKIYDRTGKILLYDVHKDVRRTIVPFESISPDIKNASVAIEDQDFYNHGGVRITSTIRALKADILIKLHLQTGFTQGGSTITQQVIKNALLSQEKTISRKIKEWILAIKLEHIMNKEQILTLYLNEAPYGGNIYGVEEASMSFFGKHAGEVSLVESAYLAALPQAPTLYSPYGNHTDKLEARKNLVLKKMFELHMITEDVYNSALTEKVKFIPQQAGGIRAPHFVMFIKEKLVEMYGEDAINDGGFRVITTLDMDLQKKAEDVVKQYAAQNEKAYNAKNEALVAIDPKTGQILTMVGSRDYFDVKNDGNYNIALAKRQPGSSFKPFVYAAAFEKGYTPDTVLFDTPTQFSTRCDPYGTPLLGSTAQMCYMPENYDHVYRGPMTLRNALAQSVNIPAVKLLYLVGLDSAIDMAQRLGITTLVDKSRYGLTLVLGGGEVSLLEMTSAYGVFANDGKRDPYTGLLEVDDTQGQPIYQYSKNETQVIDSEVARKISDVLSDNIARAPAFGENSFLRVENREVAVKTGTTNNYRDAWIIGYTPSIVVGAWAGNNDNTAMQKKVAGFIIAPLWNAFWNSASSTLITERFPSPQPILNTVKPALRGIWYGGQIYKIDKISGKLATEFTPSDLIEERVIPNPHEILFWVDKNDPTGKIPTNPYGDSQFLLWEIPVEKWITENGLPINTLVSIPEGSDDLHKPEFAPQISFSNPTTTTTYLMDQKITIHIDVRSNFIMKRIDLFLNNNLISSIQSAPYEFSFIPSQIGGIQEMNELRAVGYDVVGNTGNTSINLLIN